MLNVAWCSVLSGMEEYVFTHHFVQVLSFNLLRKKAPRGKSLLRELMTG